MQSLTKAIGRIFQPLLDAFGGILAFFYSIVPNYPIDVALLTILIMAVLTPLTVKSTKNMAAMQALAPEMKKLQQKYKGDRVQLNEEMMKLYKEHNVNPASGCLPLLLQMPAFFVLYSVIRGITNTVTHPGYTTTVGGLKVVHPPTVVAEPRYIPVHSKMYEDIVAAHGQLNSFGMNFADKLLSHHSSVWAAIPFLLLVVGAVGLQYLQMARLNARNPQAAQANPQAAMLQKYMPLIFGFIYINVAAILNVYFIVSSAIRIATQEIMFRKGIVGGPPPPPAETSGGQAPKHPNAPVADRTERALPRPKGTAPAGANGSGSPRGDRPARRRMPPSAKPPSAKPGTSSKSPTSRPAQPTRGGGGAAKDGRNGSSPARTGTKGNRGNASNGRAGGKAATSGGGAPKAHPRSKSKRERKAR
jgi:YidC/Oxa1 family membrane protein insertase